VTPPKHDTPRLTGEAQAVEWFGQGRARMQRGQEDPKGKPRQTAPLIVKEPVKAMSSTAILFLPLF